MPRIPKKLILDRLHDKRRSGTAIVGAGAGTGLSAKCEEAAGVDLIVIYNSGRFRMAGRGSLSGLLAYGNANSIVREMGAEVLPIVAHTPVLAGVNATDPFIQHEILLQDLIHDGFSGVQNFPTVGLIDGVFRANLEETGMGYHHEVEMIGAAAQLGLLTTPYVFSIADATAMATAGADVIVCHFGLTTGGAIGAHTTRDLPTCAELATEWAAAARDINPDIIVLVHGGPISSPEDAAYVLARSLGVDGFYGASSMERLPTETAMVDHISKFVELRVRPS